MKGKIEKGLVLSCILLGLIVLLIPSARADDKVQFGIGVAHDIYFFPGFIAKDKGFWKANGIDIDLIYFQGTGELAAAAGSGKIKFGASEAATVAMAVMRGVPIKMVSARALTGKSMVLIAQKEIKNWKDLKGKKIGITRFGGGLDFMLRKTVEGLGWDPEKDISILPLGGLQAHEAAFLTRKEDAFGWTIDVAKKFEKKYGTTTLFFPVESTSGIFVHNDLIKDNPDLVRRVLRAWYQASRYMRDNPDYTIKSMVKEWDVDEEDARALFTGAIDDCSMDGVVSQKGLETARESLKLIAKAKESDLPPIESFFTPQFLPVK